MGVTNRIMRHSMTAPSFEALDVSVEEEVIHAQDASNELMSADAESDEISRLQDVADHTAQSVDYIETQINEGGEEGGAGEATQNEVALAEQVANLATVGTGEDADTVMPSSESYIGSTISCEGLKETVRNIIRAVIAAIKKLWDRLKKFWRSTMSRLSSLKKSALELKARASKTTGTAEEKKIKISASISGLLAKDGSVQKEYGQISSGLRDFKDVLGSVDTWSGLVAAAGETIADAVGDIDVSKATQEEAEFVNKFDSKLKNLATAFTLSNSNDKRFIGEKTIVKSSKTFLGEKAIFARERNKTGENSFASNIASFRLWLDAASPKVKEQGETDFNTMSGTNVADLADIIVDLTDKMAYYAEGKGMSKVEKSAGKVEKAMEKLGRSNDLDDVKTADAAAVRRMIALGHAFADWSRNPAASIVNHICTVSRAVLTVGTRSLSQYK